MRFLFDTNICIYLIKKANPILNKRVLQFDANDLCISSITVAELEVGIYKSIYQERSREALDTFLIPFDVLSFDQEAANIYGRVRADLEKKGTPIDNMDLLIAAHALSLDLTLVTNNEREFKRIVGLKIENWAKDL